MKHSMLQPVASMPVQVCCCCCCKTRWRGQLEKRPLLLDCFFFFFFKALYQSLPGAHTKREREKERQPCLPSSSLGSLQKGAKIKKSLMCNKQILFRNKFRTEAPLQWEEERDEVVYSGLGGWGGGGSKAGSSFSRQCFIILEMMQTGWGGDAENRVAPLNVFPPSFYELPCLTVPISKGVWPAFLLFFSPLFYYPTIPPTQPLL